jgi:hypothetical protein
MAVTFTNIVVGEAVVKVDNVDVGATQDGAAISWEPDMVDIEIDQFGDAARVVTAKIKVHVKTKLAEGTLDNLVTVWNYPTSKLTSGAGVKTLNLGLQTVYPTEHTLILTGNAPGTTASVTKTRTYTCGRVISYSSSEHTMKRSDNISFPVDFRILPDPSQTGKEYGTIVDVFP